MQVSVYVCTFGQVTYAGIAQNPYRAVSKLMMDGTQDVPVTECGKAIKAQHKPPWPQVDILRRCSLRKALHILREYVEEHNVISDYNYSIIDDDDMRQKPYVKSSYPVPCPKLVIWGTDDAVSSLEEEFFTATRPHEMLQGSLCDIMTTIFRRCIVMSRTPLGHSMAYNKGTRSVIIRTSCYPFVESYPLYKFCIMAVGWVATALEYLVSRILSGCKNEKNTTYDTQKTIQYAYAAYRLMHTIEGNKTWLECTRIPCAVRVELTQAFATCLTDASATPEFVRDSFEKLRRLYPDHHPDSPDFRRYKKKLLRLHGEEPIKVSFGTHLKKKIPKKSQQ